MPGMLISLIVTLDVHSPGSIIVSLVMTPDCFTAWATWLPVAFLRSTLGELLHALRVRMDAMTQILYFMAGPLIMDCISAMPVLDTCPRSSTPDAHKLRRIRKCVDCPVDQYDQQQAARARPQQAE